MQVVAEGVETLDVWRELQVLGCDILQGYVIARPLTPLALTSSLCDPKTDYVNHRAGTDGSDDFEAAHSIAPLGQELPC
jgi:EAL domain-containing protein (putative c-di-GMP-specific phosphodiesterase class I)